MTARLTSLEHNGVVVLSKMLLSRLDNLGQVEDGDGGRRVRPGHLPAKSTGASWELVSAHMDTIISSMQQAT